jgi:predicted dehydrogenase
MSRLKLALIGCGGMGLSHLRRFHVLAGRLQLTAIVDIDLTAAQQVAQHFPEAVAATDYRDILDRIDAVLIALPHHLHHGVALDCIKAGKHVLLEKPMAISEEQCLELISASEKSNKTLMIAYCMRFHPLITGLKEALDQKLCGDLFQLSIWTEQHTQRPPDSWICSADTLGGGQLFSHGCHYIDLLLWYMGKPIRGSHMGTNRGTPWMEREGTSNVCLQFAEGRLGYHFGTWGARGSKLRYAFHAHCDEGLIEADITGKQLAIHRGNERQVLLQLAESSKHTENEMAHFLECIETGAQPITDARSSLEGLRVIWRLYQAEDRGELADFRDISEPA